MKSKLLRTWIAGLVLGAAAILPALGQSVYVVTITDLQKQDSYEVMTREQLAELKARIQTEARLFPAAVAAARKAWEASDLTKDKPFQTAGLAARKFRPEGPFSQEMAKKKAEKKIERDDQFGHGMRFRGMPGRLRARSWRGRRGASAPVWRRPGPIAPSGPRAPASSHPFR